MPRAHEIPTTKLYRDAEHNGSGLKALAFTISDIPHSIFSKHISADKLAFLSP